MSTIDGHDNTKLRMTIFKFNPYFFLKRTALQLVVSVSAVLSLCLCYSWSSGFSVLPNSLTVYFTTWLFSFFTHTLERKYMFLLCNGILAFLAKSSVSSTGSVADGRDSSEADEFSEMKSPVLDEDEVPVERSKSPGKNNVAVAVADAEAEAEEEEEEVKGFNLSKEEEQEEVKGCNFSKEEERESEENRLLIEKQEEEEDIAEESAQPPAASAGGGSGDDHEDIKTDELNRKIEEFIRKMKEEIRIEAQQRLIAV